MEKWGLQFGKLISKVKPADVARSWKIFKGDTVKVISGDHKGEEGKVLDVKRSQNLIFIEGINLAKKIMPESPMSKATIYNVEQGINVSNVALIDPVHKVPTKIGWKFTTDSNGFERKIRVSKLSGEEIPRPPVPVRPRLSSEFATASDDVAEVTFVPDLNKSPLPQGCII